MSLFTMKPSYFLSALDQNWILEYPSQKRDLTKMIFDGWLNCSQATLIYKHS
jgi:hypothetical protein